jgi:hypothetical protein
MPGISGDSQVFADQYPERGQTLAQRPAGAHESRRTCFLSQRVFDEFLDASEQKARREANERRRGRSPQFISA